MVRVLLICFVLFAGSNLSVLASSKAGRIVEGGESRGELDHSVYSNMGGEIHDRILCIDGLKVFQSVAYGYGDEDGGVAVSNIQLHEEKDGRVVPATCKEHTSQPK